MQSKRLLIGMGLVVACLAGPVTAGAQCETEIDNLNAGDFEYMGQTPTGQSIWVGQEFFTDCDGEFLTVEFLIEVQFFPEFGIDPLVAGDVVTCTVMDDQNRPIASVERALTAFFGFELLEFDFKPLELGLAAGTLGIKLSTRHERYCRVTTSLDQVPGRLMLGNESSFQYINTRDAGFKVTWDPTSDITPVENQSWGGVKALFR